MCSQCVSKTKKQTNKNDNNKMQKKEEETWQKLQLSEILDFVVPEFF